MLRMLEAQAPAKQTATDTINTLCSRLASATLLEDRRAAILGLRSFAKEYPASVASGSLRGLIAALTKDAEDLDTIKVVLETLLMLFNPDENSPEASEDISLWLADEFTQRQDNITLLLDLLEATDFYSRRYSLKLLKAISELRPERTQECILSAPLGIPRLVAALDDPRDAVRDVALDLLIDLTQSSTELQKIVAFQNAFEKIFNLVDGDGSIRQGSIVTQDCLTLTANLIQYNPSNQLAFRESGCVPKLAALLTNGVEVPRPTNPEEEVWESPHKEKNLFGLLAVLRMFLVKGSMGTAANQDAFHKHGILQHALELSFDHTVSVPVRSQALYVCADAIRGNARLQEIFAQTQVAISDYEHSNQPNGEKMQNGISQVHVIEALLHLILGASSVQMFDARFAACECLKAYFYNHDQTGRHFLNHAVNVHLAGEEDAANVVTTLVRGPQSFQTVDPYRLWFAAVITFHLLFENPDAKSLLMGVVEGDAESGEEVVTCIQEMSSNLISSLQNGEDERVILGYLMVLCGWLFEDPDAVNDFLGEGASIQTLVTTAARTTTDKPVIRGLCAVLLGIIYEFSTKDSPIPRRELQPVLLNSLGREKYLDAITQLRTHPFVREFEVMPQGGAAAFGGNLPDVFFDSTFVDFLKDNFSRLSRAIDRDPGIEIQQNPQGVDRDLVDTIRGQLDEKSKALESAESKMLSMERQLNEEQANHRKDLDTTTTEINRIKNVNEALQRNHEADVAQREAAHSAALQRLEEHQRQQLGSLNAQLQQKQREAAGQAASFKQQHDREVAQLRRERAELEDRSKKTESSLQARCTQAEGALEEAKKQWAELQTNFSKMQAEFTAAQKTSSSFEERSKKAESSLESTTKQLKEVEMNFSRTRTDLSAAQGTVASLEETVRRKTAQVDELTRKVEQLEKAAEATKTELRDVKAQSQKHENAARSTDFALREAQDQLKEAQEKVKEAQEKAQDTQQKLKNVQDELAEKEEARASAQGELDDMLMVLSDLEEKRAKDKKRLKELGEEVSDGEDEDEDEEDEEEDEEDEEE
ncbi:Vesicle-mediated ER to Golgi transport protein [Diplodia intermedia]|uniref:Vesicle-mediated ER to Golgi transport protein n=1 Tax=Diplodia intermedia TaxID=856260 RepID=A0ABR3TGZ6_9PEZI